MRFRDNDLFFTVDVPVFRIRSCTPAEAAARAERWDKSRARSSVVGWRPARTQSAAPAGRPHGCRRSAAPEPPPPWHEFAAGWQRVCANYDGLFLSDEEEEQVRVAFHQGGAPWRIFLTALDERKRYRTSLVGGAARGTLPTPYALTRSRCGDSAAARHVFRVAESLEFHSTARQHIGGANPMRNEWSRQEFSTTARSRSARRRQAGEVRVQAHWLRLVEKRATSRLKPMSD